MSAFTDLIVTLDQPPWGPVGSLYGYMFDEGAGAGSLADLVFQKNGRTVGGNPVNLPLTPNAITLGESPGLIAGHSCARQDKDTHMASRVHNALLDVPTVAPGKFTLMSLFEVTRLKGKTGATSGGNVLVQKGGAATLLLRGTSLQAAAAVEPTNMSTPGDLIAGDGVYWAVVSMDEAVAWNIVLNGVEVVRRNFATPTGVPAWAGGGDLYFGGHGGFGNSGLTGRHAFGGLLYNNALGLVPAGLQLIRDAYLAALAPGGEEEGLVALVAPWSRLVVPADPDRERLWLANDDDTTIYLRLTQTDNGGPAFAHAGPKLAPFVGEREWVGAAAKYAFHAIHPEPAGLARLLIQQG